MTTIKMAEFHSWTEFLKEIVHLIVDSERQFGVANSGYCNYIIERFELCLTTWSSSIVDCIERSSQPSNLEHFTFLLSNDF